MLKAWRKQKAQCLREHVVGWAWVSRSLWIEGRNESRANDRIANRWTLLAHKA